MTPIFYEYTKGWTHCSLIGTDGRDLRRTAPV